MAGLGAPKDGVMRTCALGNRASTRPRQTWLQYCALPRQNLPHLSERGSRLPRSSSRTSRRITAPPRGTAREAPTTSAPAQTRPTPTRPQPRRKAAQAPLASPAHHPARRRSDPRAGRILSALMPRRLRHATVTRAGASRAAGPAAATVHARPQGAPRARRLARLRPMADPPKWCHASEPASSTPARSTSSRRRPRTTSRSCPPA